MPRVKVYACDKCAKEFRDAFALTRHIESKKPCDRAEPLAKQYTCPTCEQSFSVACNLRRHIAAKHPDVKTDSSSNQTAVDTNSGTFNNNNEINNQCTNNITNNITINFPVEFGKENVKQLIEADWSKLGGVSAKRDVIESLIKFLNCSEKKPENHNVLVPDEDSDKAYVYAQKNWRQRECDDTLRDCISNMSLKAQDALVDKDFHIVNPTHKTKIDACLETLELMAEQADRADKNIAEEVEQIKSTIVSFTQRHPDLLDFAIAESAKAPKPKKYKKSVVFKGYEPDGVRRAELLEALQKGDNIPSLDLEKLALLSS